MEPSNGTVWHDEIQIGKWRSIAARGITPNHRYHQIKFAYDGRQIAGEVWNAEHFSKLSVVSVLEPGHTILSEFDLDHLDVVEVEA